MEGREERGKKMLSAHTAREVLTLVFVAKV